MCKNAPARRRTSQRRSNYLQRIFNIIILMQPKRERRVRSIILWKHTSSRMIVTDTNAHKLVINVYHAVDQLLMKCQQLSEFNSKTRL
jgi:hypothetical protein